MAGKRRANSREQDEKILGKAKEQNTGPAKSIRGFKTLVTKIATIKDNVEAYLGDKKNEYQLITKIEELNQYIDQCIKNGFCAIDTETTGLNPLDLQIVGFSLYTKGRKPCYIPINHLNYVDCTRVESQLTEEEVRVPLQRAEDARVKWIFFNANFDIRVLEHTVGVRLNPYYDAYIASRLLNENERDGGLKGLHKKYVLEGKEDAFSFGQLFSDVDFRYIPIETAYLYGARDAIVTYELYEFQMQYIAKGSELAKEMDLEGIVDIFWDLEMPLINVVVDMEDRGVRFDFDYQKVLSKEYHEELDATEQRFYTELKKYTDKEYSISSSKQLCELFYDDLKVMEPRWDRKTGKYKRTVDKEAMTTCTHPLCEIIMEYRKCAKLLSTYVDKLAEVAKKDGRVHGGFNQLGTVTGRFSSSDPKQNWALSW